MRARPGPWLGLLWLLAGAAPPPQAEAQAFVASPPFHAPARTTTPGGDPAFWEGVVAQRSVPFPPAGERGTLPRAPVVFEANGVAPVVDGPYGGASDHSTSVALAWTATTLYLRVEVQDDVHINQQTVAGRAFAGDSLQVMLAENATSIAVLLNCALTTPSGALLVDREQPLGPPLVVSASRDDARSLTTYEVEAQPANFRLPRATFAEGDRLGLAVAVNEQDVVLPGGLPFMHAQQGWDGWNPSGILFGKIPAEAGTVVLAGCGEPPRALVADGATACTSARFGAGCPVTQACLSPLVPVNTLRCAAGRYTGSAHCWLTGTGAYLAMINATRPAEYDAAAAACAVAGSGGMLVSVDTDAKRNRVVRLLQAHNVAAQDRALIGLREVAPLVNALNLQAQCRKGDEIDCPGSLRIIGFATRTSPSTGNQNGGCGANKLVCSHLVLPLDEQADCISRRECDVPELRACEIEAVCGEVLTLAQQLRFRAFVWANGSPFDQRDAWGDGRARFVQGEPNNWNFRKREPLYGHEPCMVMHGASGAWNDVPCEFVEEAAAMEQGLPFFFICEMPPPTTTAAATTPATTAVTTPSTTDTTTGTTTGVTTGTTTAVTTTPAAAGRATTAGAGATAPTTPTTTTTTTTTGGAEPTTGASQAASSSGAAGSGGGVIAGVAVGLVVLVGLVAAAVVLGRRSETWRGRPTPAVAIGGNGGDTTCPMVPNPAFVGNRAPVLSAWQGRGDGAGAGNDAAAAPIDVPRVPNALYESGPPAGRGYLDIGPDADPENSTYS